MSDKILTIKEYADLCGVSTTVIYKKVSKGVLKPFETVANGKAVKCVKVSESDYKALTDKANKDPAEDVKTAETDTQTTTDSTQKEDASNPVSNDVSNILQTLSKQLEVKDKQIAELTETVRTLTDTVQNISESLKAAQLLHAGTMQKQLPESEAEEESQEQKHRGLFRRRKKK